MKIKNLIVAAILVGSAFVAQQASAAWTLFDNFNSYTDGNLAGQGGWVANGAGSTMFVTNGVGVYGINTAAVQGDFKPLGALSIAEGSVGTVFMQWSFSSTNLGATEAMNFGITTNDAVSGTSFGNATMGSLGYLNYDTSDQTAVGGINNSNHLRAANGGLGVLLLSSGGAVFHPAPLVTYDFWLVVSNNIGTADTYQVYVKSDSDLSLAQTQLFIAGTGNFAFRNGGSTTPFDDILLAGGGANTGYGFVDNIFGDSGVDLSVVPEPGIMALMGLGGAALILVRRNRKA